MFQVVAHDDAAVPQIAAQMVRMRVLCQVNVAQVRWRLKVQRQRVGTLNLPLHKNEVQMLQKVTIDPVPPFRAQTAPRPPILEAYTKTVVLLACPYCWLFFCCSFCVS